MISKRVFFLVIFILLVIIAGLTTVILAPGLFSANNTSPNPKDPTFDPIPSPTPERVITVQSEQATSTFFPIAPQSTLISTATNAPGSEEDTRKEGVIILSMRDGNDIHLFAYHPLYYPLTRLTDGLQQDITPAISPDQTSLAFSSNRDGQWDLYILDLKRNLTTRLTNTPQYDGAPSWSPDGQWITYESYVPAGNLEIMVQSVTDPSLAPIQLTENPAADHSPAWSPGGREIAFVSSRSGDDEIWLARLDLMNDRFVNLSIHPSAADAHPSWSPSDRFLAWSSERDGIRNLVIWDREEPDFPPKVIGNGSWPTWNPDGSILVSEFSHPNQNALNAYRIIDGSMEFSPARLPGMIYGMDWVASGFLETLEALPALDNARNPAQPLWQSELEISPAPVGNRIGLVEMLDLLVPYPFLSDAVDESFAAWRNQTSREAGWDVLANLQNAFVPITNPVMPMLEEDWLTTGRAIQVSPRAIQAGWMILVREDYGGQTYWRVFIKARFQDGSQGRPLTSSPWDLDARYSSSPISFEQGGQFGDIPTGYWIDLTEIALRFGWERLPSLINWRSYYNGVRFNQFALRQGLDWYSAMRQLYPAEALRTATPIPPITPTFTSTPTVAFKVISTPTLPTPSPTLTKSATSTPVTP